MIRAFDKPPAELSEAERTIKKENLRSSRNRFVRKSSRFNKSGVSKAKSPTGQRFPADTDTLSIPFADIKDSIRLCYIYPASYDKYPERLQGGGKHNNVFELSEALSATPSMIEMRLAHQDFDLEKRLKQSYTGFVAFRDISTLRSFGLVIYTIFRRSPNARFPSHHAFIAERY
jgi:hypothetical protein